jgi:hypothetical protein
LTNVHDRRSRDLPLNAEVASGEVDDPLALEPGEKIVALRSIRNDPLARLHSHHQMDDAQYRGGRAFRNDGSTPSAARKAVLRLNRAERELGGDGSALVHDVLIHGMTLDQVGQCRSLTTQRWRDYFARRFCECLDRLALVYGFATPDDRKSWARAALEGGNVAARDRSWPCAFVL